MSKRLKEIVKIIQAKRGWTQEEVAKSIKYSAVQMSRLINSPAKHEVEEILIKKFPELLQNVPPERIVIHGEEMTEKDHLMNKAVVKVLYQEVAKLNSKVFGRPFQECLDELEQNTILVLRDLERSK